MLESLINRDSIVRREILEMVLKTNDKILLDKFDFILKIIMKIKSIDTFISGVILMNKNSYFGTYSLDYNRDIINAVIKKRSDLFLKIFTTPTSSQIFKNNLVDRTILKEITDYYNVEKLTYFYLYQKKFYDCYYKIDLEAIQRLKSDVYKIKNLDVSIKYFSNKNTISIRKGKEIVISDIIEVIFKIFQDVKINQKLDNFVRENYSTEYLFIKKYLENCRN